MSRPTIASPPYVLTPDSLIARFARDPLTIGVWIAIVRLVWRAHAPVPLAAAELAAWAGCPTEPMRVAIMRRIRKLEACGWLCLTSQPSEKHTFIPAWGQDAQGGVRPWQLDRTDLGRPTHLRGRRVPIALLDDYLGQLTPQAGRHPALITRCCTQALLDLADVGSYAIALRTVTPPPARLRQLGLADDSGVCPPLPLPDLLAQVATGQITGTNGRTVGLTAWGLAVQDDAQPPDTPPNGGRSGDRSTSRSPTGNISERDTPQSDGPAPAPNKQKCGNAWNHESEPTNQHESPSNRSDLDGGGACHNFFLEHSESPPTLPHIPHVFQQTAALCDMFHNIPTDLTPRIAAGHQALNPARVIFPGEWFDLLALQKSHGEALLLTWQARASRTPRVGGITPAYYRTCATQEAVSAYHPPRREPPREELPRGDLPAEDCPRSVHAIPRPALDPACDALLRAMGLRAREQLAHVPLALIQTWQAVLDHPGLAEHFADVRGFAHSQLRAGNAPPSATELERWAHQAQVRRAAQPPPPLTPAEEAQILEREAALQARLAAIAPPDLTPDERLALLVDLEAGYADAEALERLAERRAIVPSTFTVEQVARRIVAALHAPIYRPLRPIVGRLELAIDAGGLRLGCRHVADLSTVQTQVLPLIRQVLSLHGWPTDVQVVSVAPVSTPQPTPADAGPPDWIAPVRWATLPPVLCGALVGSTLGADGELHCSSPALLHCAQTRYARELAALLAAHQEVNDGN